MPPSSPTAAIDAYLAGEAPRAATSPGQDEPAFRAWYDDRAARYGLGQDPDDPRHQYDYRAAFKAGAEPDPATRHWPSRFKLAGHPNLIVGGRDTRTGKPAVPPSLWQERKGAAAAIDEFLALPDQPPKPFSIAGWRPQDLPKLATEGPAAMARAFTESQLEPTWGQALWQRSPLLRYTPIPGLLDLGARLARLPSSFGRAVAEVGPEKAKPLTETFATTAPFLGRAGLAALRGDVRSLLSRPRMPTVEAPVPLRALPPGVYEAPGRVPPALPPGPMPPRALPPGAAGPFARPGGFGPVPGPGRVGPQRALPPARPPLRPVPSIESELLARIRERRGAPKRPYEPPVAPLEVKGAPLEGEVLDRFGRPIKAPPPTVTERERLRALHKGRLGTQRTPARQEEARLREIVEEGGGRYRGIQSIAGRPSHVVLDEPHHGSTLYVPIDEATPARIRAAITGKRAEYAAAAKAPEALPPLAPGHVRLYRAEPIPGTGRGLPGWVAGARTTTPEARASAEAEGRWFTPDPGNADWYLKQNLAPGTGRLVYVDVPEDLYRTSRVSALPADHPARRFSRDPESEVFLPLGWAARRRPAPPGPPVKPGDAVNTAQGTGTVQSVAGATAKVQLDAGGRVVSVPASDLVASTEPPVQPGRTFFERTKLGEQAMIEGTEARAIPTTALKAKTPQAPVTETPLFEKPGPVQTELGAAPPAAPRGQHYGKTVDVGTVRLTDPEEVRIFLRDQGGLAPGSIGLDVAATPKEFIRQGGRPFDELVQEIADAQGLRPKQVESMLNRTLSRYGTMRQELREEGLFTEIRSSKPPSDVAVSPEEWRGMSPSERKWSLEFFRDMLRDERGSLDLSGTIGAWKRFRRRLPMEEAVRKARPDSPVISEVERWNVGLADGLQQVAESAWWRGVKAGRMPWDWRGGVKRMNPEQIKDLEAQMVAVWQAGGRTPQAREAAIRLAPPDLQAAMSRRDFQLSREQVSRSYFELPAIPEQPGPYLARRTEGEAREAVSLGGGRLGIGRGLQTTVRGHQQERVFETYRQGEQAGTVYEDPRNAIIMREWEGLKLRATHRLFRNLEGRVLFQDKGAAAAASPTGRPFKIENAPGGTWWARTEAEARFLEQNLTESFRGPTGAFVHYGNALIRNPSLVNPSPHLTKNMWMKALLARGPVGVYTVPRDAVEYFRRGNPALRAEFEQVMPFTASGRIAGDILGQELRRGPLGQAIKTAIRAVGSVNRPSAKVIFQWGDPAMRYSLYKHYRGRGMAPYEAANHAWVDLIRYGTRSDLTDFWKALPLNFFVPWRFGTLVSLIKQVKNHPVRTAMLIAGVDYLREVRYRQSGKWTHLPWDYTENPLAIALQNRDPKQIAGILGTTALFGPGGAFAAGQLVDALNEVRGRGEWGRVQNMFWGISQLYNLPKEWAAFRETGDVKYLADMLGTALLGEHTALSYQPRRLMRALPESLPGLRKSPLVEMAERLQEQRQQRAEQLQERRQQRPRRSIEDQLRASGYVR